MGVVIDVIGEVVIGVSIVEIGIMNGIVIDLDGNFIFFVVNDGSIRVLFVGY